MKALKILLTPTRNRRLNEVIGVLLLVAAVLLFLSLVSYRPTDPSFNTVGGYAGSHPAHNWIGLLGAALSDMLLQVDGIAAFFLPLLVGSAGWMWLRSRPAGSPTAKGLGVLLYLICGPAALGLLPGHLLWEHALPVEGLLGRLAVDALQHYLNFPGAAIVIVSMLALSLYLSTTFSFTAAREWMHVRFAFLLAWRDRIHNWRIAWRKRREAARLTRRQKEAAGGTIAGEEELRAAPISPRYGAPETRTPRNSRYTPAAERPAPSIWDQMPRTSIPDPGPEPELPLDLEPVDEPVEWSREPAPERNLEAAIGPQ